MANNLPFVRRVRSAGGAVIISLPKDIQDGMNVRAGDIIEFLAVRKILSKEKVSEFSKDVKRKIDNSLDHGPIVYWESSPALATT